MNTELTNVLNQIKQDKDENLTPQNLKKGVTALGIVGNYDPKPNLQTKYVDASGTSSVSVTADQNFDGLNTVIVNKVNASIDEYLVPENIRKNIEILGITGTYGSNSETKRVSASASSDVVVTPSEGVEFMSKVIVDKVTATIDPDIIPQNIRHGQNILGVEGTYAGDYVVQDSKVVESNTLNTTVTPDHGFNALEQATVKYTGAEPVKTVNAHSSNGLIKPSANYTSMQAVSVEGLTPNIIKYTENIFGVQGNYQGEPTQLQEKTVSPSSVNAVEVTPDSGYDGLAKVTINKVTSSTDPNISSGNIRSGVSILGVFGSVVPQIGTTHKVDPLKTTTTYYPSQVSPSATGFTSFTVNGVTSNIDSNITAENIKNGVNILGVEGNYDGGYIMQDKTADPSKTTQIITPDEGYDALNSVTIYPVITEDKTVSASKNPIDVTANVGTFLNSVHIRAVSADVDDNIQPENIKRNMSILGVVGNYIGETDEYFTSMTGGNTKTVGPWVSCITSIPNTIVLTGNNAAYLFQGFPSNTIPLIDTSNAINGFGMFSGLQNITTIPLYDFSKMTTVSDMFNNCTNLTALPQLNMTLVQSSVNMFQNCKNITVTPELGFTNLRYSNYMFSQCNNLTTVANLDMPSLMYAPGMFWNCTNLSTLYNINLPQLVNMDNMFNQCYKLNTDLDISSYRISSMQNTFRSCSNLYYINFTNANFKGLTSMNGAFAYCSNLRNIGGLDGVAFNTSEIKAMEAFSSSRIEVFPFSNIPGIVQLNASNAFRYCRYLTEINPINTVQFTNSQNTFLGCSNLITVKNIFVGGYYIDNTFTNCSNLMELEVRISGYLQNTFKNCTNLRSLTINVGSWSGSYYAFSGTYNIRFARLLGYIDQTQTSAIFDIPTTNLKYVLVSNASMVNARGVSTFNKNIIHYIGEAKTFSIENLPNKLTYNAGESFEPEGMVLNATDLINASLNFETNEVIETYTEPYDTTDYTLDKSTFSVGDTSVNLTHNGLTVEIPITVTE